MEKVLILGGMQGTHFKGFFSVIKRDGFESSVIVTQSRSEKYCLETQLKALDRLALSLSSNDIRSVEEWLDRFSLYCSNFGKARVPLHIRKVAFTAEVTSGCEVTCWNEADAIENIALLYPDEKTVFVADDGLALLRKAQVKRSNVSGIRSL
jgi:hypothetical protein